MRACRSIIVLLAAIALATLPALAQQVGVATAVNPLSESTAPGASTVALTIGARIVHKERIHTTPQGTVQLLFGDQSTLSIAPNSNILIDEYVYDPSSNSGHMLTRLALGALRFVGGKLSHQGETKITTPAAAIGIRGGTATISHGPNGTRVINHFGVITIQNGAGTIVISRPGFAVTVLNWNSPSSEPLRVTEAEIAHYLRLLTSQRGQNGGVSGFKTIGILTGYIDPGTVPIFLDNGESDAFNIIIQATQHGTRVNTPTPSRRRGN